jgi:hypothetical protein
MNGFLQTSQPPNPQQTPHLQNRRKITQDEIERKQITERGSSAREKELMRGKPDQRSFSSVVLQISQQQAKTPPKNEKKTTKNSQIKISVPSRSKQMKSE